MAKNKNEDATIENNEETASDESEEMDRSDYMDASGRVVEGGATAEDIALDREASRLYVEHIKRVKEKYNLTDEQVEEVLRDLDAEED